MNISSKLRKKSENSWTRQDNSGNGRNKYRNRCEKGRKIVGKGGKTRHEHVGKRVGKGMTHVGTGRKPADRKAPEQRRPTYNSDTMWQDQAVWRKGRNTRPLTRPLARLIFTVFCRNFGLSWETSTFKNYHPEDSQTTNFSLGETTFERELLGITRIFHASSYFLWRSPLLTTFPSSYLLPPSSTFLLPSSTKCIIH